VGQRCVLIDIEACFTFETDAMVCGGDEGVNIGGGHPWMERSRYCAVDEQCGMTGQAHAFDFMGALDHSAAGRNRGSRDEVQTRVGDVDSLREDEGHVFVKSDRGTGETTIGETTTEQRKRAFIFLPGEDVAVVCERPGGEEFVRAILLECGADEKRLRAGRENECPQAFSTVNVKICEIDRRTGGVGEDNRVDFVLGHQLACTLDASVALGIREWSRLVRELGQCFD